MDDPILVTGAGGFIGGALCRTLREVYPSRTLYTLGPRKTAEISHACDLLNFHEVSKLLSKLKPRLIFHCAGTTRAEPWKLLVDSHVTTTENLLEAVRRTKPPFPRVVILGSAAEYGRVPLRRQPILESEPSLPVSPYGISKALQTKAALFYAGLGVPVVVARIFNLLGAEQSEDFAVPRFIKRLAKIRRKGDFRAGDISAVRDFISVKDACRALIILGKKGRPGTIYNVSSGRGESMKNILKILAELENVEIFLKPSSERSPRTFVPICVGDSGRLRGETGWFPRDKVEDVLKSILDGEVAGPS